MTLNELLAQMHTYTKIERYLMTHRDIRNNQQQINKFNQQLNPEEVNEMLVPIINESDTSKPSTFPANFFFSEDDPLKVKMTQHTRYSTPILHKHDFYEMFYVYEGEFTQLINQKSMTMHTGDICLIQPGVYHSLDVNNYSIVLNILIERQTFESIFFNDLVGENTFSTFFRNDFFSEKLNTYIIFKTLGEHETQDLILKMYLEILNKSQYYTQVIHSYLLLLFSHLLRHYMKTATIPKPTKKQDLVDFQIITAIQKDYQTITLPKLAQKFHYSTQYISQRIKHATGLAFSQFLLNRRMQIAVELLKGTEKKVKTISEEVGYNNVENFIRTFKREQGISPAKFRQALQEYH
ncbi:AraC family transcriptional regulator [Lactiplantibacillus sp. WILCCON 0030]|uniref:AraC family transcriptional regulator n=1 Tax=Lactiplantibacillus brownii TaxID=3069269 RepID=A0ABU1A700_9LACO|nr:AraC family transcriptional regulator [Lactiplantibacillus brownii]MDQ7936704.1 AraC family transcriptional regulator [Lactiplantibacillus brownii]